MDLTLDSFCAHASGLYDLRYHEKSGRLITMTSSIVKTWRLPVQWGPTPRQIPKALEWKDRHPEDEFNLFIEERKRDSNTRNQTEDIQSKSEHDSESDEENEEIVQAEESKSPQIKKLPSEVLDSSSESSSEEK